MIFIGVDLGFYSSTTITVVNVKGDRATFMFESVREGSEMMEVIDRVSNLANRHGVLPENVSCPKQPGTEKLIRDRVKRS